MKSEHTRSEYMQCGFTHSDNTDVLLLSDDYPFKKKKLKAVKRRKTR